MPLTKEQKKDVIENLKQNIADQKAMMFVDYAGTVAADFLQLKKDIRDDSAELKVAKKTLLQTALKDDNAELAEKVRGLEGQVAVVFSYEDEAAPAKKLAEFAKTHEGFTILGGFINGQYEEAAVINQLATLPSQQELRGQLVGQMQAPVANFVGVLRGTMTSFLQVLSGIQESKS